MDKQPLRKTSSWSLLPTIAIRGFSLWLGLFLVAITHLPAAAESTALAAPELLAPVNGAVTTGGEATVGATNAPLGVPTFSWAAVAGATQYQLELSASSGFSTFVAKKLTYATTYTPEAAFPDGNYFWRVAAYDGKTFGAYSEVRTFTKDWSNQGQNVPQLMAPLDQSARAVFTAGDFSWTAVTGAATYRFELTSDPTFNNVAYTATTIKPQHTPVTRLQNNTYYWRVTPVDRQGNLGKPSAVSTLNFNWSLAPQLLAPASEEELKYAPHFQWSAVEAAKLYQVQLSTQPDFSAPTVYSTPNTDYTPSKALSNDQDYYWRVKAVDNQGTSSPWSETRHFRAKWNFQPRLLTPPNNSIAQGTPFFSWTPIPGVERYQLQVDESNSFATPLMDVQVYNTTTSAFNKYTDGTILIDKDYFWHVRGIDSQGNYTPWSSDFAFRFGTAISPNLVYPLPYYPPDSQELPVHADRTMAWPLFLWDTAHAWNPFPYKTASPDYYQVTVAADPNFQSINFQLETAGIGAAPTLATPLQNLVDGQLYYWRVRAYRNNQQMGTDTTWVTRIDRTVPQLPTTDTLVLDYPADSFEAVGTPPVLGWQPVNGASNYHLQISANPDFTALVDESQPQFVNYVPWQGRLEPMPFGTYWWRVQAEKAPGVPLGDWSEIRHFNLSLDLVNGNPYDFVPPLYPSTILSPTAQYDPALTAIAHGAGNSADPYWLNNLHVMLNRVNLRPDKTATGFDNYSWLIAFQTGELGAAPIKYGIYVDIDHVSGSGGATDPLGKPILVNSLYLPEYVIYVTRSSNSAALAEVVLYAWNGSGWNAPKPVTDVGGDAWFDSGLQAIQLSLPYTALAGDKNFAGSLALTLFSTSPASNEGMYNSIPPQTNIMVKPAFVSDMLMPMYPFDTPLTDPIVHFDLPPLRWRMPYFDSNDGYQVQVARDAKFTDLVETWEFSENGTNQLFSWLPNIFQSLNAYEDNESYYWRVRMRHERFSSGASNFDYSPWSPAQRFKLDSRQVGNPTLSTGNSAQMTPTFTWQRVEGAAGYTLQVDDDANFSSPLINEKVASTSYTPIIALPDRNYFWRVATRRNDKIVGHWSPVMTFVKKSFAPTPISPLNDSLLNVQPTFQWTAILTPTDSPRLAAPLYQLQVDSDPNFSAPTTIKTEATTYTFVQGKGVGDGTFYWRVAALDANNNLGAYSPPQQFRKEYQQPSLLQPAQGETLNRITTFAWAPMPGAAYYQFDLATDQNFTIPKTVLTDNTAYTPIDKLSPQPYYWRVRMVDGDKRPGPFIQGWVTTTKVFLPVITKK